LRPIDQHARIDAERPADQAENDNRADAETVGAAGNAEAAGRALIAVILTLLERRKSSQRMCCSPFKIRRAGGNQRARETIQNSRPRAFN
jgi:hypothetical protein